MPQVPRERERERKRDRRGGERRRQQRDWLLRMREEENESEAGAVEDDYGSDEIVGFGEREEMAGREKRTQMRERERIYLRERSVNKQIIKIFATCYNAVSFMKSHCSMLQKILRFETSHET